MQWQEGLKGSCTLTGLPDTRHAQTADKPAAGCGSERGFAGTDLGDSHLMGFRSVDGSSCHL